VNDAANLADHISVQNAGSLVLKVSFLAKIAIEMKIYPEDANADLNELKERIKGSLPKGVSVHRFNEEPVAFGLKVLIASIVIPGDEAGLMEPVEEAVKTLSGVSQIEVMMVRRV